MSQRFRRDGPRGEGLVGSFTFRRMSLGRKARGPRGKRLFGFKAHFRGPGDEVVELFFRAGSYAGVSPVEYGITNVCGLAPEDLLARYDFEIDVFAAGFEILAPRLAPLTRVTKWFLTGALVYGEQGAPIPPPVYRPGETYTFLGSGLVNAVATGRSAGVAAREGFPRAQHAAECHRLLRRPLYMARFLRMLERGLAEKLGWLVLAGLLFRATRLTTSRRAGR